MSIWRTRTDRHTQQRKENISESALAVIVDQAKGAKEISLNELLTAPCNIGKTFNLDAISMLDVLYQVERIGKIKINRTAGLDVIHILEDLTFQDCVDAYYTGINKQ